MRLKSYFVHTMEEAMQAAKVELGVDAMLVDTKRLETPPGGRTRLEVIFAAPATPPPPPKVHVPRPPVVPGAVAGLQRFRVDLTTLLDALSRTPDSTRLEALSPARQQIDTLRARLLLSEVPPVAADAVVHQCQPVLESFVLRGGEDFSGVQTSLQTVLAAEWPCVSPEERCTPGTLAFVGPAGAGKTSAIAKLAFYLGVSKGTPVTVFSLDNLRIGASDQLAHLCSLLGVPFHSVDWNGGLTAAIGTSAQRGFTLIDTPGYGASDRDIMEETAAQIRQIEGIECHLVLPATLRFTELHSRYAQYEAFAPKRLLFTRLDEAELLGPAWAFARDARLPVNWVSTGPGIPEDIEAADAYRFAAALMRPTAPLPATAPYSSHFASAAGAGGTRI